MNSKIIFDYILKLENENNDLKNKNEQLIINLNDLNDELNNLKKVSLMLNFNKQLKEKETTIANLENQIRNIKNKKQNNLDNKTDSSVEIDPDLGMPTIHEPIIENKPEPIIENKPEPIIENKPEPIIENKPEPIIENKPEPIIEADSDLGMPTIHEPIIEKELNEENKKKKKKTPKNCEIIKYKSIEYLLNNDTNEIFELNDRKLSESLGILKNGKVKFYKK